MTTIHKRVVLPVSYAALQQKTGMIETTPLFEPIDNEKNVHMKK